MPGLSEPAPPGGLILPAHLSQAARDAAHFEHVQSLFHSDPTGEEADAYLQEVLRTEGESTYQAVCVMVSARTAVPLPDNFFRTS